MRIRKRPRTSNTNFMHYNPDIGAAFPNDGSNTSGVNSLAAKNAAIRYRQRMRTVIPNYHVEERESSDLESQTLKIEGRSSSLCRLSDGSNPQHIKEGWPFEVDQSLRVPTDSLLNSLCRVLSDAGGSGLTAREAASKIKEKGFAGLNEASPMPSSVKIAKLLRSSPQFKQTAGGKFIMTNQIQSCTSLGEALGNCNDENSQSTEQQQKVNQVMTSYRCKGGLLGSGGKKLKHSISSNDKSGIKEEQSDRKMNCWRKSSRIRLPRSSRHACLHQIQNSCFKSEHKTIGIYSPEVISSLQEPHCGDTPQDQLGSRNGHLHSESSPRRRKRVKARYLMSIMRTSM
ncbi:hypothetical protein O6H91_03G114700 [Diphasiastrum complanatum]|uniref:Uncharacterized protein n=1 Tax=Diphasiastrum complanatum TaxID=34168 RepID=A0ACC2EAA5_DIPCM|nr:hypothetical protein O6H91_03G114700 [Diphasiastrum complanatum]